MRVANAITILLYDSLSHATPIHIVTYHSAHTYPVTDCREHTVPVSYNYIVSVIIPSLVSRLLQLDGGEIKTMWLHKNYVIYIHGESCKYLDSEDILSLNISVNSF